MHFLTLRKLYEQHEGYVSDKWSIYLEEYDRLFSPFRERPISILEIGVQNGGSLLIWSKYFASALHIVGCDINPDCSKLRFTDPRIAVVIGDANTDDVESIIATSSAHFDLVVDDGSHNSSDIVRSFPRYFERLSDGGLYVAEDLHCSYWAAFEGGLFDPTSSISFFKQLADVVNFEHWGNSKVRSDLLHGFGRQYGTALSEDLLAQVHSVEFVNSMCIVKKRAPAQNVLGRRIVAGDEALVVPALFEKQSTLSSANEHDNPRSKLALEDEVVQLRAKSRRADFSQDRIATIQNRLLAEIQHEMEKAHKLQTQIDGLHKAMKKLKDSFSWRATTPIRAVTKPLFRASTHLKKLSKKKHDSPVTNADKIHSEENRAPDSSMARYEEWLSQYDPIDQATVSKLQAAMEGFSAKPRFSIILPTYNSNSVWLKKAVDSVVSQIYTNWELCIADDASTSSDTLKTLREIAASDSRIKIVHRTQNGHISAASNSALELATGEWIVLLDHDDVMSPHALFWVATAINLRPDTQLIYSDEDKIDEHDARSDPYFKSDWNVDLFYSHNMFCHLGVYRADLVKSVGGFRLGTEGSQDYDLVLRCMEKISASQIIHVPKVLYSWRIHPGSTAMTSEAKPYALIAGEKVLNEHFQRTKVLGHIENLGTEYRARYQLAMPSPHVSIVVCTYGGESVRRCIDSILTLTDYPRFDIVLVASGVKDASTKSYLQQLETFGVVKVIVEDENRSYPALNNIGVSSADGEFVVLVQDGVEVRSPQWLTEMISIASQPSAGAVGLRLLNSSKVIQCAGIVLNAQSPLHVHQNVTLGNRGYLGRAAIMQSFSALSGACLAVSKQKYLAVGGLNEKELSNAFSDIDFCLRIKAAGYRNLWSPYADLQYCARSTTCSASPSSHVSCDAEMKYLQATWNTLMAADPAYNPNLSLMSPGFGLAWPPRAHPNLEVVKP
jgi:glycosyltransferase involved in cell wall biosynthesis